MSLTASTGTVSLTQLRANCDDKTATLLANARAGAKDHLVPLVMAGTLVAATVLSLRTVAFTAVDDYEVRTIFARGAADAGSRTLIVTLTVDNGDAVFLGDNTVSATVTSNAAGTFDTRTLSSGDYRTTTGTRVWVNKGVRYRLTLTPDAAGTWTNVIAGLQLRTRRRRT